MATLKAQMNSLSPAQIDSIRFNHGNKKGFQQLINDTGAFRVHAIKAKSAVESYTDALQKQDVVFRGWRKSALLRNQVLKEQYRLQNMSVMGWKEDGLGRISADMIIPRDVPARLESFKKSIAEVRAGQVGLGTVLNEQRMRIGLWSQSVKSATHNMINWGKNTQWAGRQMMVGLSLPFAALAAGTGLLAYQVDKELTRIVKVYDYATDNVEAEGERLRESSMKTAKSVARDYGQAATDTLNIMGELAATGKVGAELQETARIVSQAAFLGELDRQDAIKTTITLQTVYRQSNEQLAESFAYLNSLENATSLQMKDMTVAIPKLAGVVKSLGGDLQDIGTLMTAAKAGGLSAAEGANALKTVLFRSVVPYGRGRETFLRETNMDLQQLVRSTNGEAIPTLVKMGQAMKGLDQIQRTAVLKDVFGIYQGSKAGIMIEQMLSMADATTQVGQAALVAEQGMAEWGKTRDLEIEMMQKSASGQFKIAIESIKAELADMGEPFLEVATVIVKFFTGILNKFNELGEGTKKFLLLGLAVGAIIGPLVMITGVMATFVGTIMRAGATLLFLASRFKAVNADQHAASLLAKQSTLAFQNQGAAAQILSTQLKQLSHDIKTIALANLDLAASKTTIGSAYATPAGNLMVTDQTTGRKRRATRSEYAQINELGHQRSILAGEEKLAKAAEKTKRNYAGIASGIGGAVIMMQMLTGGTNKWIFGLGIVLTMMPGIIGSLKAIIKLQFAQKMISGVGGIGGALNKLIPASAGVTKGLAAMAPALGPLGLALGAAGAGIAFLHYKLRKTREEAEALSGGSKGIAAAMGVDLQNPGKHVEEPTTSSLAKTFKENNKEAAAQIRKLAEAYDTEIGKQNFENRVIQIGLDIYKATGDAEKARRAVDAAIAVGGNPEIKIDVDFANNNWAAEAERKILDGLARITASALDSGAWYDRGLDEAVKKRLEEQADVLAGYYGQWQDGLINTEQLKAKYDEVVNSFADFGARFVAEQRKTFSPKTIGIVEDYFGREMKVISDADLARALLTDTAFFKSLDRLGQSSYGLTTDIRGLREGFEYLGKTTFDVTGMIVSNGAETKDLSTHIRVLGDNTANTANAIKGLGDEAENAEGDLEGLNEAVETAADRQKKYVDSLKGMMGNAWGQVLEAAADQIQDGHDAHIARLERGAENTDARLDEKAKKRDKEMDRRQKEQAARHKAEDKSFSANWKDRAKAVERSYDDRVKKIEDVMDAEKAAEKARQKAFDAEKRRVQRLAEMYNMNVDFNVALNTGDKNEAAKLANDIRATQEQWGLDDASEGRADAHERRMEALKAEVDGVKDAKSARMDALKEEEALAKELLDARQEREKEALNAEKARARESVDNEKKAQKQKSDAAIKSANDSYNARKKAFEQELAALRTFVPQNEAELRGHVGKVQALYEKHGFNLNIESKEWAKYVANAMSAATATAQMELSEGIRWEALGKRVGGQLSDGILDMSFEEFIRWMETGILPAAMKAPENPRQADRRQGNSGTSPKTSPTFTKGGYQAAFHSGGPIKHSKGSGRAGRPLSAGLFSDEVPIIAQTGEFMMQRDAVDRIGVDNLAAMNAGNLGPDKTGRMHSGGIVSSVGAMVQAMWQRGMAKAMMVGAARKAGEIMSGQASGEIPDSVFKMLSTGATVGGTGQYGNSAVKFSAPGIPGMSGVGVLPPGTVSAAPPGEDGFASWLTDFHRSVRPDVLAKVWKGLAMVPGQQLITSGRRSATGTVAGSKRLSLHGSGRAVDIGALARKDGGTSATEAMGDHIAAVFRSGVIPGVSEVLWKTMTGGNHFNHVHVGFRHGGGEIASSMTKGLKSGGYTLNDGYAKLHKSEAVLTAPLTAQLERGIQNLDSGGGITYDIKMDLRGALIKEDIDIEAAVERAINKKESRMGRKRTIN